MKRVLSLLLVLLLLLAGCGRQTSAVISETSTATAFSMTHTAYTGHRETTLSVNDSATATVTGSLTSKSGSQTVTITDENGNVAFAADGDSGASNFTVKLTGPATYTIAVDLTDHTGSYSFEWEVLGAASQEPVPSETTEAVEPEPVPTVETAEPEPEPSLEDTGFSVEDLDWNGVFTAENGTLELWQADSTSYEFAFQQGEASLVGVARIDLEDLITATCTLGSATVTFTWLDTQTLSVTADGTVAALTLDPTGTYTFTGMN
jgi:hypothetical protein